MAARQRRRRENLLPIEERFRNNAFILISTMLELNEQNPERRALVDEILHSIFFLGKINIPPYLPHHILNNGEVFDGIRARFPRPFDLYSSQVPQRCPFSCVADMLTDEVGQENEYEIRENLQALIKQLEPEPRLSSATMCVSQKNTQPDSVRYYGVSMSTPTPIARKVMVAISCLVTWDDYVASAVMSYYPNFAKNPNFDGTIQLPQDVRCQAFSLLRNEEMLACRSCGNLFGLTPTDENGWFYGNCAEAESLSNLFKNDAEIRNQSEPTAETYTPENREGVHDKVLGILQDLLQQLYFEWEGAVYSPL
ncbi:hypothetical protein LDENG_00168550 [Lucifuga dentata]|nr:hypothetical protein LDENG_00168550 [Lucifuga dentata]